MTCCQGVIRHIQPTLSVKIMMALQFSRHRSKAQPPNTSENAWYGWAARPETMPASRQG